MLVIHAHDEVLRTIESERNRVAMRVAAREREVLQRQAQLDCERLEDVMGLLAFSVAHEEHLATLERLKDDFKLHGWFRQDYMVRTACAFAEVMTKHWPAESGDSVNWRHRLYQTFQEHTYDARTRRIARDRGHGRAGVLSDESDRVASFRCGDAGLVGCDMECRRRTMFVIECPLEMQEVLERTTHSPVSRIVSRYTRTFPSLKPQTAIWPSPDRATLETLVASPSSPSRAPSGRRQSRARRS